MKRILREYFSAEGYIYRISSRKGKETRYIFDMRRKKISRNISRLSKRKI